MRLKHHQNYSLAVENPQDLTDDLVQVSHSIRKVPPCLPSYEFKPLEKGLLAMEGPRILLMTSQKAATASRKSPRLPSPLQA